MPASNKIGQAVRQIRENRQLPIEVVAERTGLAQDMISQIENGEMIPSLGPLIRIARVLGVRVGTFLDDQESLSPVITRNGQSIKTMHISDKKHPGHSDLDFFALAVNKSSRHMEPFLIDIMPSSADSIHLSNHEGEEFIYVLSGKIEIAYGKENFILEVGDSIYYDSIVPHNVHSIGDKAAKILAVVYAPY